MDNQKEVYRLWFEYLKRSENYNIFCLGISGEKCSPESIMINTDFLLTYLSFGDIFNHDF